MKKDPCFSRKMPRNCANFSSAQVRSTKKPGGGTAAGGGLNFQAAVTAIFGVHLLRGSPMDLFRVPDVPVAVWAESEGAGDDVRVELASGAKAEIQAKKGLKRGMALWEPLEALIKSVSGDQLAYGALAVAPDSSRTILNDLSKDLDRLGQGRVDHLTDIGIELHHRLQAIESGWQKTCQRVCIRAFYSLKVDGADIKAAKESLRSICDNPAQANAAWNAIYADALSLIEYRGRWTVSHLLRLLQKEGVPIRDAQFPAAIASKLNTWVHSTHNSFNLPAVKKHLPLCALLKMRTVGSAVGEDNAEDAAAALARYHDAGTSFDRDATIFAAEWTGRFRHHSVVVGGPGMGKSTLMTLLANRYSSDGFPVLSVKLKSIAAAMEAGNSFDRALRSQALDGSGIIPEQFDRANLTDLVILADGLDDCGVSHDAVARALAAFAIGHSSARIVVTTRPIGYKTSALADWRHYRLLPPPKEHGARNLTKLLNALKGPKKEAEDVAKLARLSLSDSRAEEAISRSPHLLGMAATLISSRGKLPNTRPRLYSELITLFRNSRDSTASCPVSSVTSGRVLNCLGWLLLNKPLLSTDVLIARCADLLVESMGGALLDIIERIVEPALRHWERVGLIEQLHHDSMEYWTFVHKSFAEFTAARYLMEMPDEKRKSHLNELVDKPDWQEVMAFAGGLGLGEEVAHLLVERPIFEHRGQLKLALDFLSDRDVEVTSDVVQEFVENAFEAIQDGTDESFSIGRSLADLSKARPSAVHSIITKHLHHESRSVRLVAWACAVSAEPDSYEANELIEVVSLLLPTVRTGLSVSLLGNIILNDGDNERRLVELIVLAAAAAQPKDELKAFAEYLLAHGALDTTRFHSKMRAILMTRGVSEELDLPQKRFSATSMLAMLNTSYEWRQAYANAIKALAEGVHVEGKARGRTGWELSEFPQFGALVALTRFDKVPSYEVYQWSQPYDATAVRHVLQALVHSSSIDPHALRAEAAAIFHLADRGGELLKSDLELPTVDIPEPDWNKAAGLISDRSKLVAAMNHGSIWMASVSGSILAVSSASPDQSRALLDDIAGTSLWAATEVVRQQQPADVASSLILDRLAESIPDGSEFLFKGLQAGRAPYSPELCEAIRCGLASNYTKVAVAAAELAADLADRGQSLEPHLIAEAYDDWQVREPEPEGSIIPPSPRETLLTLLISQNILDDDRLFATLSDDRSDVRRVGEERLLDLAATSSPISDTLIERMLSKKLTPAFAAAVLRREIIISEEQILALESLMGEPRRKWRRVGVELLRRCYLSPAKIRELGEKLSEDDESEIRQAAKQRLAAEIDS